MRGQEGYGVIALVLMLAAIAGAGMAAMNAATANQVALANRALDRNRLLTLSDSLARNAGMWMRGGLLSVDCREQSLTVASAAPERLRTALQGGHLKLESCDPRVLERDAADQAYTASGHLTAPPACSEQKIIEEISVDADGCAGGKAAIKITAAFNRRLPSRALANAMATVPSADDVKKLALTATSASLLGASSQPPSEGSASEPDLSRPVATTRALLPLPPDALCASISHHTLRKNLVFPANGAHCAWGMPAEAATRLTDAYFHAYAREAQTLEGLEGKTVCALRLAFGTPRVGFDDELFLTWGGVVLLASAGDAVQSYLPAQGPGRRFAWSALDDQRNWEGLPYCPPGAACTAERGEHPSPLELSLPDSIVPALLAGTAAELAVIVTGDNNPDTDCHHDELSIGLEVEYVDKPR